MFDRMYAEFHSRKSAIQSLLLFIFLITTACGKSQSNPTTVNPNQTKSVQMLSLLNGAHVSVEKNTYFVNSAAGEKLYIPLKLEGVNSDQLAKNGIEIKYQWFRGEDSNVEKNSRAVSFKKDLEIAHFGQADEGFYDVQVDFLEGQDVLKSITLDSPKIDARVVDDPLRYMFPKLNGSINDGRTELNFADGLGSIVLKAHFDLGTSSYDKSKVYISWSNWKVTTIEQKELVDYGDVDHFDFSNTLKMQEMFVPLAGDYSISGQIYYNSRPIGEPILMRVKINVADIYESILAEALKTDLSIVAFLDESPIVKVDGPIKQSSSLDWISFTSRYGTGPSGSFLSFDMFGRLLNNTNVSYIWTNSSGQILSNQKTFSTNTPGKYKLTTKVNSILSKLELATYTTMVEVVAP